MARPPLSSLFFPILSISIPNSYQLHPSQPLCIEYPHRKEQHTASYPLHHPMPNFSFVYPALLLLVC